MRENVLICVCVRLHRERHWDEASLIMERLAEEQILKDSIFIIVSPYPVSPYLCFCPEMPSKLFFPSYGH